MMGIAGQDTGHITERLPDMHTASVNGKLADLLVVSRTAHFKHGFQRVGVTFAMRGAA